MKIKVTAVTSFTHGSLSTNVGQEFELTKVEATELEVAGLVVIGSARDPELEPELETNLVPERVSAPSQENGSAVDDDVAKMAAEPQNKMAAAPANKISKSKAK